MDFMPKNRGEKVKCKKCGKDAFANELVLDKDYKMMVCPLCIREKKVHKEIEQRKAQEKELAKDIAQQKEEQQPAGWDSEDKILEQMARQKEREELEKPTVIIESEPGSERVKMKCKKCNYQFSYNLETQTPALCPMCGTSTR